MVSGNHFLKLNISRTHKRPFAGIYIYVHMKVMVYIYGIWKRCLFKWIFLKYARLYMKATDHYWEILPVQINILKSLFKKSVYEGLRGFAGIYIWRWWFRILRHQSWFSYSGWKKWKLPLLESIFHEMKNDLFFCDNSIKKRFFFLKYKRLLHLVGPLLA